MNVFTDFELQKGRNIHALFGIGSSGHRYPLSECADATMAEQILSLLKKNLVGVPVEDLVLHEEAGQQMVVY